MNDPIAVLLECLLPEALAPFLQATVGDAIPRVGRDGRFRVAAVGRFSGHVIGDLMAQAQNHEADGALVLVEGDVVRVLYLHAGRVIGAESNVLFERLGRILGRLGKIDKAEADLLIEDEEQMGVAAVAARLPQHEAGSALEVRAREIACGLFFMPHAHYFVVEGRPGLGDLPALALNPMELAVEGLRRYDEWRNRSSAHAEAPAPSSPRPASPKSPPTAPAPPEAVRPAPAPASDAAPTATDLPAPPTPVAPPPLLRAPIRRTARVRR